MAIAQLRQSSVNKAIQGLVEKIDPAAFLNKFGAPISDLPALVKAKTVTVQNLLEISPIGTFDPTPTLYNTTMYAMACLLVIGFVANFLVKPVHSIHHLPESH